MSKLLGNILAVSAVALAFSIAAQAQSSRTFVSTTGNDSNAAVNCSATASCRTFAAALSKTNPGGEVVVLDSGGYGPAEIVQAVTVTAIGVDASISVTTSQEALFVGNGGNVTLIGLSLHGEGIGTNGITFVGGVTLRLYNMLIESFTLNGVRDEVNGAMEIYDSEINDNGSYGVVVANGTAYVSGTSFDHNKGTAVAVYDFGGQITVADSSLLNNAIGAQANSGTVTLVNDRILSNNLGLTATGGALYFSNCLIDGNTTAYSIASGTITGTNPGTSFIAPGQAMYGTLAAAATLQ
jgi:hypothetical protein